MNFYENMFETININICNFFEQYLWGFDRPWVATDLWLNYETELQFRYKFQCRTYVHFGSRKSASRAGDQLTAQENMINSYLFFNPLWKGPEIGPADPENKECKTKNKR